MLLQIVPQRPSHFWVEHLVELGQKLRAGHFAPSLAAWLLRFLK
jgi:hypothetical protein